MGLPELLVIMKVIYGRLPGPGYDSAVNHKTRFLVQEWAARTLGGWPLNAVLKLLGRAELDIRVLLAVDAAGCVAHDAAIFKQSQSAASSGSPGAGAK
jgi:hypothetical protein